MRSKQVASLSSTPWEWSQASNSEKEKWAPCASFPTVIHQELLAIGAIPDPNVGLNELDVQWVGEQDWQFRTTFVTPADVESFSGKDLVFDGLDTVATVFLNGETILESDNMFVAHRVDVSQVMKAAGEENILQIRFESPDRVAKERYAALHGTRPSLITMGQPSRVYLRKAQYHWGWDWGE